MRGMLNAQKGIFLSDNYFDFPPCIAYTGQVNAASLKCIDFDSARRLRNRSGYNCLHFYCDDYKFESVWTYPERYIDLFKNFKYVIMTDFSLYFDFPNALKIYNKYRNHWLWSYFMMHGVQMIPSINLSSEDCFPWSILGYPKHSIVAISDIGRSREKLFTDYRDHVIDYIKTELEPLQILYFTRSKNARSDVDIVRLPFIK